MSLTFTFFLVSIETEQNRQRPRSTAERQSNNYGHRNPYMSEREDLVLLCRPHRIDVVAETKDFLSLLRL